MKKPTKDEVEDGCFKEQGCTITLQQWDYHKTTEGDVVMADFSRNLERERNEARQYANELTSQYLEASSKLQSDITELNQRLIERQESFQAQLIRIENGWREKLKEKDAQIAAMVKIQNRFIDALDGNEEIDWRNESDELLRKVGEHIEAMSDEMQLKAQIVALREALEFIQNSMLERGYSPQSFCVNEARRALSTPAPSVVPLEDVHLLLDGEPAMIVRNAKDGYPEGREDRVFSIEERIAALKQFAADYQRWLKELEDITGVQHP